MRYFVLILVTIEKVDSPEYVDTNGRIILTAKSGNVGNSVLALSQIVPSLFWENSNLPPSITGKFSRFFLRIQRKMLDVLILHDKGVLNPV